MATRAVKFCTDPWALSTHGFVVGVEPFVMDDAYKSRYSQDGPECLVFVASLRGGCGKLRRTVGTVSLVFH